MIRRGAPLVLGLVTLLTLGACAKSESAPSAAAASRPADESAKAASGPALGAAPMPPEAVAAATAAPPSPPPGQAPAAPSPMPSEQRREAPASATSTSKSTRAIDGSGARGSVSAGEARVSAGLTPEVIHNTVKQNFDKILACYETGLHANPALQGRVTVKLVIGSTGSTKSAIPTPGDFPDKKVVDCIGRAFNAIHFPPPTSGEVTVSYPVLLSPST